MKFSKLILSGLYKETGPQTKGLLSAVGGEGFRYDRFYLQTDKLVHNSSVKKILIVCRQDFSAGVFGGLEEIRDRLKTLADSGKELYFYAPAYGLTQLFLASVCTHKIIHPLGTLRFTGFARSFSFYKQLMRRYGIDAEIIRRGSFKSAGDSYRTDSLDDAVRVEYERYFDVVISVLRKGITEGFGKTEADLDDLLKGKVLSSVDAIKNGWLEKAVTDGDLENEWKKAKDKNVKIKNVSKKTGRGLRFNAKTVAVLVFEGIIIDGHSRRDPLMGQAVGSDSFIPHIRKLSDDRKVKAVVLRINSGGGSAFASESITAELRLLAEKKPLIVSMSEIAGSGGYWMSCCGRKTFALPTTLTGSIGVISIYFSWYRLLDRLGITSDTIKIGEHSDVGSPLRELTVKERENIDAEIGAMYDNFVSMVAEVRNLTKDEVDSLGQGRVWAGIDAVGNKLVDETGGITAAIRAAGEAAGIRNPVVKFYPEIPHSFVERLLMNKSKEDEAAARLLQSSAAINLLLSGTFNKTEWINSPAVVMEEVLNKWI
jgi:protease-4